MARTPQSQAAKTRRQIKAVEQAADDQRARARQRLAAVHQRQLSDRDVRHRNAVIVGLLPRIQGAVNAWCRTRVPITLDLKATTFEAATNFKEIHLDLPQTDVSADYVGDLRGLAYHEAGHIIRSVPWPHLAYAVGGPDPEHDDIRSTQLRAWLDSIHDLDADKAQEAWNVLEDQRMETGMVRDSKNLAPYYNVIVLTHVVRMLPINHLLLYGRRHVDPDVRAVARQLAVDDFGLDTVQEAEQIIRTYMEADKPNVMFDTVVAFTQLIERLGPQMIPQMDEHYNPGKDAPGKGETGRKVRSTANLPPPEDEGDEGNDPSQSLTPDEVKELVEKALQAAKDLRNADSNVTNDLRSYNQSKAAGSHSTPLERVVPVVNTDPAAANEAATINRQVRNLIEQARAETAPSWQQGQRNGVLDVIRWKARQPGEDRTFFRNYVEGGDLWLPNMAVSVVLDGSGSMEHADDALGVTAFAMKSVCDAVEIPCVVSVYDTNSYLVYDRDDRPRDVHHNFIPGGGTDPKLALDMLDNQMADKDRHLVIIMTDGIWDRKWHTQYSLANYAHPRRDIVVFYYRTAPTMMNGHEVAAHYQITELTEMSRYLNRHIVRAL